MRRLATPFVSRAGFALLAVGLCLLAQSTPSRDAYRAAFRTWRDADPDLERDAGAAGDSLAPRTAKAAAAEAAYGAARSAFLRDFAERNGEGLQWLRENEVLPLPDLAPAPELIRVVNREIRIVTNGIPHFANDRDKAIQQLRQAFEQEQTALESLKTAIQDRQKVEARAGAAALAAEQARTTALGLYPSLADALAHSVDLTNQETSAWAAYYPALAEASRAAAPPPAPSPVISSAPPEPVPATPASAAPALGETVAAAPASTAPRSTPAIPPLPLSRYVGVWSYHAGGLFHGSEPESVEVKVSEENGRATGTLSARFKLPAGGTGDPVLRFTFAGDFRATRNQTFILQTSDGVNGTVDLIPGGQFNVLEVNFETGVKAGKIHQGDVLLVKQ